MARSLLLAIHTFDGGPRVAVHTYPPRRYHPRRLAREKLGGWLPLARDIPHMLCSGRAAPRGGNLLLELWIILQEDCFHRVGTTAVNGPTHQKE